MSVLVLVFTEAPNKFGLINQCFIMKLWGDSKAMMAALVGGGQHTLYVFKMLVKLEKYVKMRLFSSCKMSGAGQPVGVYITNQISHSINPN